MSFASTPLGQGRRLDHHTFLNKAAPPNASSSTQIHATNINHRPHASRQNLSNPTTSYAYGASATATSRSPPRSERSSAAAQPEEHASDSEQPALVRFARLKQLEQVQQPPRPREIGPRTTNTSINPTKWSVQDTSVNVASAFHRAASSIIPAYDSSTSSNGSANPNSSVYLTTSMNPNDSWASGAQRKPALPRSTSVEYEKETQAVSRRLANPPPRSNLARPPARLAKAASVRLVPDSEGEEDAANDRGKSPFEHVIDVSRRLAKAAPTTFFLRRQSQEPEARAAPQPQSPSYDYSAEEREFQASSSQEKSNDVDPSIKNNAARKRSRISVDNKAYKPTVSDLEESDEEVGEDGKKTRRRRTKKSGASGGLLTNLPSLDYDKRRRRRRGTKENGLNGDEESEEEEQQDSVRSVEQPAFRRVTPVTRVTSTSRASMPPPSRQSVPRSSIPPETQFDMSGANSSSMAVEAGLLEPILESDEPLSTDEFDESIEILSQRSFSVGATLGRGVHWIISLSHALALSMWSALLFLPLSIARAFGHLINLIVFKPVQWLGEIDTAPLYRLVPYGIAALGLYAAWAALNSGFVSSLIPSRPTQRPVYQPPSTISTDDANLIARLQRLEAALPGLSYDNDRARAYIENDAVRLAGKLNALESQVERERVSALEFENKLRSTGQQVLAAKQEIGSIYAKLIEELEKELQRRGPQAEDKEARAQLRRLQEQLAAVEGEVREALELVKHNHNEGPIGDIPAWLKNAMSGETAVTIKSTDGDDVSGLIDNLVQSAVKKASRDTIARPDYAMYSSGASVIPSLTSDTYEIKPSGMANKFLGFFNGQTSVVGRPPVTALHHENHNGHCWPFRGTQGQLGVMLALPTRISDVTIDHVSREVATDMRAAPRQMELWGLVEGTDNIAKYKLWKEQLAAKRAQAGLGTEEEKQPSTLPAASTFMRIASFTYDAHSDDETQTFPVPQEIKDLNMDFGIVALLIQSNWGRDDFTCLYRLRVHGEPIDGIPALLPAA